MGESTKKRASLAETKRKKAMELAKHANLLLDDKYFLSASAALKTKNRTEFFKISQEAGIPCELIELLWKLLLELIEDTKWGWA